MWASHIIAQKLDCKQRARNRWRSAANGWRRVLLAVLLLPSLVQAQTMRGYAVEIIGAGPLAALLNEHLEIRRHAGDTSLSPEEIQRLAGGAPQQIRELLATEGYFSPTVESHLDRQASPWIARFQVTPGEPTRIDAVDIRFSGAIETEARTDRLRRQWRLKPGQIFRQTDWNDAKNALLKELLLRDFPAARIAASEANIDAERRSASLTLELDSGPFFTFGALQVQGLQRYAPAMIDALNPIQPGDPFSQDKLNELQARVQDTGYFRSAFATIEVDRDHPQQVPVRLDLTENERRRLALGLGFSTDSGARAQVKWLDRDFFRRGWRFDSQLKLDRETRTVGADVALPAIRNGWRPSVGAHYERSDIAGELDNKFRLDGRLTSPKKEDERAWALSYLVDQQRIAEGPVNNRQALIASTSYTMRRIDNPVAPSRGYVASAELGAGLRGVINEESLVRAAAHVTWLKPFERRWLAVLRGQAGQVFGASRDTVPGDLLFRAGGDQSVRGYAFNSLGVAQNGAVVGGRVMAVVSAELVYNITPQWGAALFTDAGNAADAWRDFHPVHGSGVGARWRSPIGPVNLDLAYGHQTHQPRLHFSVGYGF